ncbi:hypothetical protein J2772_003975 [Chryseobacterium jejuense]|nr:hypothetical protein [Chryseobacterium jejuense]
MKTNFITKFYFLIVLFIFSIYFGKNTISVNRTINDKNTSPFNFINQPSSNMHEGSVLFNTFTYVNDPIDLDSILNELGILNLLPFSEYQQLLSIITKVNTCLINMDQNLIRQSIAVNLKLLLPLYKKIITEVRIAMMSTHSDPIPIIYNLLSTGLTKALISKIIINLSGIFSPQELGCLIAVSQELLII